jgi:hypothetical protein
MISITRQQNAETNLFTIPTSSSATSSIADVLLVSADHPTITAIKDAMQRLAVATRVCPDVSKARRELSSKKFDAVLVDFDLGKFAPGLLADVRKSPSNATVPAMAITRSPAELSLAHTAGSNFVLHRPLTSESLKQILGASYGLLLRERRRYFRCRIRSRVLIRRSGMRETQCNLLNISEGGMSISSAPKGLTSGMGIHAQFVLPGFNSTLTAVCETRWRNGRGRAGLKFVLMPLEQRCDLQEWLARRLEHSLPESVAQQFRDCSERSRSLSRH